MGDGQDPSKNAVNLCSQSAYPGDEELETMETEIMVKWKMDQPPDVRARPSSENHHEPDAEKPEAEKPDSLEQARKALVSGKQSDALGHIDLALERDILNAALWLQRATVLIALGDLREAFRSCSALKPANRTADIWKMGGKPARPGLGRCSVIHKDNLCLATNKQTNKKDWGTARRLTDVYMCMPLTNKQTKKSGDTDQRLTDVYMYCSYGIVHAFKY